MQSVPKSLCWASLRHKNDGKNHRSSKMLKASLLPLSAEILQLLTQSARLSWASCAFVSTELMISAPPPKIPVVDFALFTLLISCQLCAPCLWGSYHPSSHPSALKLGDISSMLPCGWLRTVTETPSKDATSWWRKFFWHHLQHVVISLHCAIFCFVFPHLLSSSLNLKEYKKYASLAACVFFLLADLQKFWLGKQNTNWSGVF